MLEHEWLKMPSNYDTKYTEIELQLKQQKQQEENQKKELDKQRGIYFEEDDLRIETSKLVPSDIEQHQADDELSTLSNTYFFDEDDGDFLESDDDDDFNSFINKKGKKPSQPQKKSKDPK